MTENLTLLSLIIAKFPSTFSSSFPCKSYLTNSSLGTGISNTNKPVPETCNWNKLSFPRTAADAVFYITGASLSEFVQQ